MTSLSNIRHRAIGKPPGRLSSVNGSYVKLYTRTISNGLDGTSHLVLLLLGVLGRLYICTYESGRLSKCPGRSSELSEPPI